MKDYYEVLEISPQATEKDIKERFLFLSKVYHPDKFATASQKKHAQELFEITNEAYQVLSVMDKRISYDRSRKPGRRWRRGRRSSDDKNNHAENSNASAFVIHKNKIFQKTYLIGFGILAIIISGIIINQSSRGLNTKGGYIPTSTSASAPIPASLAPSKNSFSGIQEVSSTNRNVFPLRDTFRNPHKEASGKFLKDAEQGNATVQNSLGFMYHVGLGVSKDYNESARWYRSAAEQDHTQAQLNLGVMYSNGQGVRKDYGEAVKWYHRAAEHKYAKAQNILGLMYSRGQGVRQDYVEAIKWYRMAAEQGHKQAQKNLSIMYLEGRGVEKDHKEAVKWQLKSIEKQ